MPIEILTEPLTSRELFYLYSFTCILMSRFLDFHLALDGLENLRPESEEHHRHERGKRGKRGRRRNYEDDEKVAPSGVSALNLFDHIPSQGIDF